MSGTSVPSLSTSGPLCSFEGVLSCSRGADTAVDQAAKGVEELRSAGATSVMPAEFGALYQAKGREDGYQMACREGSRDARRLHRHEASI